MSIEQMSQPPVSEAQHEENLKRLQALGADRIAKELQDCGVVDAEKLAKELLEAQHNQN